MPVGGSQLKQVDIRIIAATNQHLDEMVKNKRFREDLFYRLNVIDINIPPVRERNEDIIPLTFYFFNKFNHKYQVNRMVSEDVLNVFQHYSWPGNVRQLENMVERLVVSSDGMIELPDLPDILLNYNMESITPLVGSSLDRILENVEKSLIISSYQKCKTSRAVAEALSISQSKAARLIRKYCEKN